MIGLGRVDPRCGERDGRFICTLPVGHDGPVHREQISGSGRDHGGHTWPVVL